MAQVNPGTDSLQAWWSHDEVSGNRSDSHGANTLVDVGTVGTTAGKVSNASDFNAAIPEYFTLASNATVQMGDIDATHFGWIKPDSVTGNHIIVAKDDVGINREYSLLTIGTALNWFVFNGANQGAGTKAHTAVLATGNWYFYAVYHSATDNEVGISINAGAYETAATPRAAGTTTRPMWIGEWEAATAAYDGAADEQGYYKKILTTDNLEWLYNSANGRSYADLTAVTDTSGMFMVF